MDGLPPPGRVPRVCFGARLARSPARERVKKPITEVRFKILSHLQTPVLLGAERTWFVRPLCVEE